MVRSVAVIAALGLWVAPAVAKELRLEQPTLSARQDRCSPRQRDMCQGVAGQRAVQHDLSCDKCVPGGPAVPAEIMSPSVGDTPASPVKAPRRDCEPRSSSPNDACAPLPPLDAVPRP